MATSKAKINISPKEASKLFRALNYFSDTLEDILESQGRYSTEFISGLNLSLDQAKSGFLKRISSLKEI